MKKPNLQELKKLKNIKQIKKLTTRSAHDKHLVALDIGTEFVKALIIEITPDNNNDTLGARVIGVGRARQKLSDMQAGAISDITSVVANCDRALQQAEDQAGVNPRSAVIGIAGELVKGKTSTIKINRKDSAKAIDEAEITKIIDLVQDRSLEKAKKSVASELGGKDLELKLVNSALVGIEIDGYSVTNPVGFQGKEVVIQLYTAFAPMIHIGAIEKTAQELDLELTAVAAEPFAVARSVIGDNPNASMSAILVDVGGGTTDIAVIHEGGVQGTQMFGIGGRSFTKSIERENTVEYEEAEEMKIQLDTLTGKTKQTTANALEKTLDVWFSGIEIALEEFPMLDHLPNQVLLCGGGSSLTMMVEDLRHLEWHKSLPFTKRPTIKHINPSNVVGIVDKTGNVSDHTYITALGLVRVGLDTLQQTSGGIKNPLKAGLDKLLRI